MTGATPVASPCTGVCAIDHATDQCRGCRRTLDEIARWPTMREGEQRALLLALRARN